MIKYRNPRMMTLREGELVYKRIQHHYGYTDTHIAMLQGSRFDQQIRTAAYYQDWETTSELALEVFEGIDR